ncbi:hypothetical protein DXG03_009024 [Asterophora parasitica]|uniref:Tyrosine specific protein phosphatases domain-containing protein n=1 Tax=Asterophora parasitica TaxID=117018 RepID=A0A9P7G5Z2_9AGAR|nr:hypothetical protein DXG03_009024 [Asterophora parasitica]
MHHAFHLPQYGIPATAAAATLSEIRNEGGDTDTPLLSLERFAHLHLQHIVSHPPDSVLFPFLHGLEGDNHAQNTFFSSPPSKSQRTRGPTVPRYRGLVWVVAEDDLDAEPERYARELGVLRRKRDGGFGDAATMASVSLGTPTLESGAGGSDSSDFDEEDEDEEIDGDVVAGQVAVGDCQGGMPMLSVGVVPPDAMDVDEAAEMGFGVGGLVGQQEEEKEKHMHPVVQRPALPAPIQTANLPLGALPSSFSSSSSAGLSASFTASTSSSSDSSDCGSCGDSLPGSPPCPSSSTSPPSPEPPFGITRYAPRPSFHEISLNNGTNSPTPTPHTATDAVKPLATTPPEPNPTTTQLTSAPKPAAAAQTTGIDASGLGANGHANGTASGKGNLNGYTNGLTVNESITNSSSPSQSPPPPSPDLALLTCSFRPCEILRRASPKPSFRPQLRLPSELPSQPHNNGNAGEPRVQTEGTVDQQGKQEEEVWEFVPARVPDGISLRNFGIQVPIYATLSDIVVYSPKGPTANARALARRLRQAACRKWEERVERLGGLPPLDPENPNGPRASSHPDLLDYNVFLLDATASDMQASTGVPNLAMRLCGGGVPGAPATHPHPPQGDYWGAHTDGTDGHLVDMADEEVEEGRGKKAEGMYVDLDAEMDLEMGMDVDESAKTQPIAQGDQQQMSTPPPLRESNTVDFAQREKEEMRDLTKASEIISVFPPDGAEGYGCVHHTMTPSPHPPSPRPHAHDPRSAHLHSLSPTTWAPHVGQVFLGNSEDVPLAPDAPSRFRPASASVSAGLGLGLRRSPSSGSDEVDDPENPFNYGSTNDPALGFGYDVCIECHDLAPFPTQTHLRAAEEHLAMLEVMWANNEMGKEREGVSQGTCEGDEKEAGTQPSHSIAPRPPPNANAVIHLPFPSSPHNTQTAVNSVISVIRFLEKWLAPVPVAVAERVPSPPPPPPPPSTSSNAASAAARRWSSVTALMPHFPSFPGTSSVPRAPAPVPASPTRSRSFTLPPGHPPPAPKPVPTRTRPIKVLIYSADGYTESSVPALCLIMAMKRLALPEAYLELQVARRRSFFVYNTDLAVLRRIEGRLREDEERARIEKERVDRERVRLQGNNNKNHHEEVGVNGNGKRVAPARQGWGEGWRHLPPPPSGRAPEGPPPPVPTTPPPPAQQPVKGRPAAKSVSFSHTPPPPPVTRSPPLVVPSQVSGHSIQNKFSSATLPAQQGQPAVKGRPRANTSPWLPSFSGNHQSWFNDSRFDGSFPSRVLPFLYLGNLNHAANAYMLHALGITHVVSVGECALIPPSHHLHDHPQGSYHPPSPLQHPGPGAHYSPGKGPGQGSLWFEEREGRIKVLDIKGVCDDGIDTLEPQLEPICDWIDQARMEGGQVLVHCRVGVSRSATVTVRVD